MYVNRNSLQPRFPCPSVNVVAISMCDLRNHTSQVASIFDCPPSALLICVNIYFLFKLLIANSSAFLSATPKLSADNQTIHARCVVSERLSSDVECRLVVEPVLSPMPAELLEGTVRIGRSAFLRGGRILLIEYLNAVSAFRLLWWIL